MSELDELERDLMQAAEIWFNQPLHQKLQRLIAIAREGDKGKEPDNTHNANVIDKRVKYENILANHPVSDLG